MGLEFGKLEELVDGPSGGGVTESMGRGGYTFHGGWCKWCCLAWWFVVGGWLGLLGAGGGQADADAGGEEALVVAGAAAGGVDGLVAVPAEECPVLHTKYEGRLLLNIVETTQGGRVWCIVGYAQTLGLGQIPS